MIEVDEKGTEAAAATAVVMMMRCSMGSPPATVVTIDKPFLYTIMTAERTPLFSGICHAF